MKESTFRMRVQKLVRVAIPKPIYEALDIHEGDTVEITIKKVEKRSSK